MGNKDYLVVFSVAAVFIASAAVNATSIPDDFKYNECHPDNATCEYWLVIQEKLTMIWDGVLVYSHNGTLYRYDEFPENATTKVSYFVDFILFYLFIYDCYLRQFSSIQVNCHQ